LAVAFAKPLAGESEEARPEAALEMERVWTFCWTLQETVAQIAQKCTEARSYEACFCFVSAVLYTNWFEILALVKRLQLMSRQIDMLGPGSRYVVILSSRSATLKHVCDLDPCLYACKFEQVHLHGRDMMVAWTSSLRPWSSKQAVPQVSLVNEPGRQVYGQSSHTWAKVAEALEGSLRQS
jgi:hypothetical protein